MIIKIPIIKPIEYYSDMTAWLNENVGYYSEKWTWTRGPGNNFAFIDIKDDIDSLLFKLKFGI